MSTITVTSSAGVALAGLPENQIPPVSNRTIWVDENTGGPRTGTRQNPYATIDIAIGKATAGDTIIIAAGHTENLSTAAIFAVDVANLTIRGLGQGNRIPTFTTTAAAGAVMITVANTVLENLKFVAGFETGTVQAIDLTADADGTVIRNCVFRDTSATFEFLKHIDIATTIANVIIEGCDFITAAGSMAESVVFAGSSDTCIIRNNRWHVDSTDAVVDHLDGIATNIRIHNNRMVQVDTTKGLVLGIKSDSSSTGAVYDNYLLGPKPNAAVFAVTNDFFVAQNFASNDINTSGVLDPAAGAVP